MRKLTLHLGSLVTQHGIQNLPTQVCVVYRALLGLSSSPHVVGNLVQGHSRRVESAAHVHNGIMGCQALKLVGGCHEILACVLGHLGCKLLGKALLGIEACSRGLQT